MQVHAFDEKALISTDQATKGVSYLCPECLSAVRLRGGRHRALHFFHIRKNHHCRQAQKGTIHLKLQEKIQSFFEDAVLEVSFPSVGRIADVACSFSKIVYEIQYSPMSVEEAQCRINDYAAVGYTVVWILHDHTFNKRRKTPVERFLRTHPCYYSNLNERGEGIIYDQLKHFDQKHVVNLQMRNSIPDSIWPEELRNRARSWPFHHEGDLLDLVCKGVGFKRVCPSLLQRLAEAYRYFLHWTLDKSSR